MFILNVINQNKCVSNEVCKFQKDVPIYLNNSLNEQDVLYNDKDALSLVDETDDNMHNIFTNNKQKNERVYFSKAEWFIIKIIEDRYEFVQDNNEIKSGLLTKDNSLKEVSLDYGDGRMA